MPPPAKATTTLFEHKYYYFKLATGFYNSMNGFVFLCHFTFILFFFFFSGKDWTLKYAK